MRWRLFLPIVISLLAGFVTGSLSLAEAATNYFAGYHYFASSVTGVLARLPYGNPSVPFGSGFSTEWVMAYGGGPNYIQAGWLKNWTDGTPSYFVEYAPGCGSYCRSYYGTIDGNVHEYRVERSGSTWCGYIDGYSKPNCTSGFSTTSDEQYFGETTNTSIQLGGTGSSLFRMSRLSFNTGSGYLQVNTSNLSLYVSSGTNYHASDGFTSPDT